MILKYKYHSDSGLLEAYRSYTLAQNNSYSDTIVITSTALDAERYNYCLEFICYNSKSIPKAQYISPILNYGDEGISFIIPNNLTEFRGHVDMQLTGYDPDDNSIVFKSVSKNCKAFDVEGSLCVLEKDLNDTPNVFTEVLKQLQGLKDIHQDIIDEAMIKFSPQIFDLVSKYRWRNVKFYDNGQLIEEQWVCVGSKLNPPQFTLPEYCVLVGGWYNPDTESIWDMDEDTVQGTTKLYLNYMTEDVSISEGVVNSFGAHYRSHLYIPEYYNGYKVTEINSACSVPSESHLHLGNNMMEFVYLLIHPNVYGIYFPSDNPYFINCNGQIYFEYEHQRILLFTPKLYYADTVTVADGCVAINEYAVNNVYFLYSLVLPDSMQHLNEYCIVNNGIEVLRLPSRIKYIDGYAVYNNSKLKEVYFDGDCPENITDNSFVNIDSKGVVTRPKLWVYPWYYANYKAKNLAYEIGVIGQDYLDGRYAPKEN